MALNFIGSSWFPIALVVCWELPWCLACSVSSYGVGCDTTSGTPLDLEPHILNSLSAEATLYFWSNNEKWAKNGFHHFIALDSHSCTTSSTGIDLQPTFQTHCIPMLYTKWCEMDSKLILPFCCPWFSFVHQPLVHTLISPSVLYIVYSHGQPKSSTFNNDFLSEIFSLKCHHWLLQIKWCQLVPFSSQYLKWFQQKFWCQFSIFPAQNWLFQPIMQYLMIRWRGLLAKVYGLVNKWLNCHSSAFWYSMMRSLFFFTAHAAAFPVSPCQYVDAILHVLLMNQQIVSKGQLLSASKAAFFSASKVVFRTSLYQYLA